MAVHAKRFCLYFVLLTVEHVQNGKMGIMPRTRHEVTPVYDIHRLMKRPITWRWNECGGQFENQGRWSHIGPSHAAWRDRLCSWDSGLYFFLRTCGFHLSKYKGDRELEETLRLTSTRGDNLFAPFRKIPSVNSTTKRRTPPPGASRSTFGTKPLYNAATPSSRAMVSIAG